MTKSEAQQKIEAYFSSLEGILRDKNNNPVADSDGNAVYGIIHPPTLTGLALALGLDEREKLLTFTKNKAILSLVKRAMLKTEQYAEEKLFSKDFNTSGIKLFLSVNFKRWSGEELTEEDAQLPEEYNRWAE